MIAFITICYASLYLLIFNKLGLLKKTAGNIAAFAGVGVVLIAAIVFMWNTFAPMTGDARMFRFIIPIVPNVKGQVVEVPIEGTQQLSKGDTLFQIDPTPFGFAVRQLEAQIKQQEADWRLAKINADRAADLVKVQAAAQVDLDIWNAKMDAATAAIEKSRAQLDDARWQLEETTVTAPSDGYVANLQLRPGNYVTTMPLASPMAFVSNETPFVLASFSQSAVRRISVGDSAEVVFTNIPGQTFSGQVFRIVAVGADAQLTASGQLPSLTGAPVDDRWAVLVSLDKEEASSSMSQGAGGTMAVYTQWGKPVHVISKVAIRINAWLGYLTST
jgi:multidrug resistance efflux pump